MTVAVMMRGAPWRSPATMKSCVVIATNSGWNSSLEVGAYGRKSLGRCCAAALWLVPWKATRGAEDVSALCSGFWVACTGRPVGAKRGHQTGLWALRERATVAARKCNIQPKIWVVQFEMVPDVEMKDQGGGPIGPEKTVNWRCYGTMPVDSGCWERP